MQENRMFAQMLKVARQWLEGRDPEEIARLAQVDFDGSAFRLSCLGKVLAVSYPGYEFTPAVDPWLQLIALHYLHLADGTPLAGAPITFAQQKDGMVRGGGLDRLAEQVLSRLDREALRAGCAALGGREIKSNADLCAELWLFPRYPVTVKYWAADEEFPASGRLLLDASAEHYLTVEDSVVAAELVLGLLEGKQNL